MVSRNEEIVGYTGMKVLGPWPSEQFYRPTGPSAPLRQRIFDRGVGGIGEIGEVILLLQEFYNVSNRK